MRAQLTPLTPRDVAVVARYTHALWGEGAALPQYRTRLHQQWQRAAGNMQWWGLKRNTTLIASLKSYQLPMRIGPRALTAVGIAAVFTPAPHRQRGNAAQLIQQVLLHYQQRGVQLALLFSDIAPSYYQQLGFQPYPALTWSTLKHKLPLLNPYQFDPYDLRHPATLLALHRRYTCRDELTPNRRENDFRYWCWRSHISHCYLLHDGPRVVGYLCGKLSQRCLWLADMVTAPAPRARLHATLRQLAQHLGASQLAGWLRPEHALGAFASRTRQRCIPMLLWLCHRPPRHRGLRLSSLDSF